MLKALSLFLFFFAFSAFAELADRIDEAVVQAENHIRDEGGVKYLYDVSIHNSCNKNGKYACARVAAAVLKQAGVIIRRTNSGPCHGSLALAVNEVENQLQARRWKKVESSWSLKPGDVVIWRKITNLSGDCTGNGSCHVGIHSRKGIFHNDPWWNTPGYGTLSLAFFSFKVAYRPL